MDRHDEGYEGDRFESAVPHNFHCAICLNVLKQPMQCMRNEHSFCKPCITRYLEEFKRCPTCMERLTLQTLRPSRVITDLVSQLKIKCDNFDRGCRVIVDVGILDAHVGDCGFSPVKCLNDGCELIVNRKDLQEHDRSECNFRKGKCEVCGKDVPHRKRKLHCYVTRTEIDEMRGELFGLREVVTNMNRELNRRMDDMNDQIDGLNSKLSALSTRMDNTKVQIGDMKGHMVDLVNKVGDINRRMIDLYAQKDAVRSEIEKTKKEEKSMNINLPSRSQSLPVSSHSLPGPSHSLAVSSHSLPGPSHSLAVSSHSLPGPSHSLAASSHSLAVSSHSLPVPCSEQDVYKRNDVIIAGGNGLRSVELFRWKTKQWTVLPQLTLKRHLSSSFVHQGQMFVCGGRKHEDSAEVLNLTENLQWKMFPVKLPQWSWGHASVVYKNNLFIFGGKKGGKVTNDIYKVCLVSPYLSLVVCRMPEPRANHSAQRFGDKAFIVGGTTTDYPNSSLDTVLLYDITKNCCETLARLPFPVHAMATVTWKDDIIIIGGKDKTKKVLNDVVSYNIKDQRTKRLPSMKCKRSFCTAVITDNVMIVMGGSNKEEVGLNSVECFNFDKSEWEELPQMKEKREGATAVVK